MLQYAAVTGFAVVEHVAFYCVSVSGRCFAAHCSIVANNHRILYLSGFAAAQPKPLIYQRFPNPSLRPGRDTTAEEHPAHHCTTPRQVLREAN